MKITHTQKRNILKKEIVNYMFDQLGKKTWFKFAEQNKHWFKEKTLDGIVAIANQFLKDNKFRKDKDFKRTFLLHQDQNDTWVQLWFSAPSDNVRMHRYLVRNLWEDANWFDD